MNWDRTALALQAYRAGEASYDDVLEECNSGRMEATELVDLRGWAFLCEPARAEQPRLYLRHELYMRSLWETVIDPDVIAKWRDGGKPPEAA